jgi:hypothetical protein
LDGVGAATAAVFTGATGSGWKMYHQKPTPTTATISAKKIKFLGFIGVFYHEFPLLTQIRV